MDPEEPDWYTGVARASRHGKVEDRVGIWAGAAFGRGGMRRWHRERHIARRHQRDHEHLIGGDSEQPFSRDQQLGRFRKRNALDCGRARCFLCHSDKLLNHRTREELLADLKMQEGIRALYGNDG
jgi:hypothetical protein